MYPGGRHSINAQIHCSHRTPLNPQVILHLINFPPPQHMPNLLHNILLRIDDRSVVDQQPHRHPASLPRGNMPRLPVPVDSRDVGPSVDQQLRYRLVSSPRS